MIDIHDPATIAASVAGAMSLLSTVHTYLDKHPRAQALAKTLAHFAGPLNLPAMRDAIVDVCRVVVAAADAKWAEGKVLPMAFRELTPEAREAMKEFEASLKAPTVTQPIPAAPPADGVKEWPKS